MVQEQATTPTAPPDLASPEGAVQDPPQEQVPAPQTPPPAPASKPKAPANVTALQAGFYQASQRNADYRRALGLPADMSHEDVLAELETRAAPRAAVDDDELDPQLAAGYADLNEKAWDFAGKTYGEDFTNEVRHIQEVVFSNADPLALNAAVYELAGKLAETRAAANAPAPPTQEQGEEPQQPQQDGQSLVSPGQDPGWRVEMDEADKAGSGDMEGFFSKVFGR